MVADLIPLWQLTGQFRLPRLKLLHLRSTHHFRMPFTVIQYARLNPSDVGILSRQAVMFVPNFGANLV
jgi:hypothetical protein